MRSYFIALVTALSFQAAPSAGAGIVARSLPELMAAGDKLQTIYDLGLQYEAALGVPRDFARAAGLFCNAALKGSGDAAFHLAHLLAQGQGIKADSQQAAAWYAVAASRGNAAATLLLATPQHHPSIRPTCTPAADPAPPGVPGMTATVVPGATAEITKLVQRLSPVYGLDPKLVLAVIDVESHFHDHAVSPKNAQGLMQLLPNTALRFGVKDSFDPEQNVTGGMKYLRWLLTYFRGDVTRVLAAYNAGEGAVERFNGVPPYDETQNYVTQIRQRYPAPWHPYQAGSPVAGSPRAG
ncbi:MAG: transglycosylase SLT domain-containing protein [Acidobacteriaceae bacterium]|nr:transglycosylase SLT domain-containing protein [Acidobacteriaceae bacterium]